MMTKFIGFSLVLVFLLSCDHEIEQESKRHKFHQCLYSKEKEQHNLEADLDFQTYKSKFIGHFYDLDFVISVPEHDETKFKRAEYLKTQKSLPGFVKRALEDRKIVLSMTKYEFYIVLGDTSHLQRKARKNSKGLIRTEFYEYRDSLPYGKTVIFTNGFLETFGVI